MALPEFDIFLSYSSDDSAWVNRLRDDLQERGVKVWIDTEGIRPGRRLSKEIQSGIKSS